MRSDAEQRTLDDEYEELLARLEQVRHDVERLTDETRKLLARVAESRIEHNHVRGLAGLPPVNWTARRRTRIGDD